MENEFKFGDKVRVTDKGENRFGEIGVYISDRQSTDWPLIVAFSIADDSSYGDGFIDFFFKESLELVNE